MAGDAHGDKAQEEPQAQEDLGQQQAAQGQQQVSGTDWEKAVAERDEKIAALEAQVAEAARNAETAEQLRNQIAELKAQSESDRIDFKLQLAGVRNVKAARAVLEDHGGDVDTLKEAEPWLFTDVMDVEESDVLDCFVEAGAELQSTAPLLHEFAHAGAGVCPHVCRQRRGVAPVAAPCRHLLWDALLHWRVPLARASRAG